MRASGDISICEGVENEWVVEKKKTRLDLMLRAWEKELLSTGETHTGSQAPWLE